MSLTNENRKDIVEYRIERAYTALEQAKANLQMSKLLSRLFTMRRTGDYSDRFNLTEEDVVPMITPTEEFINVVTSLARDSLLSSILQN